MRASLRARETEGVRKINQGTNQEGVPLQQLPQVRNFDMVCVRARACVRACVCVPKSQEPKDAITNNALAPFS